MGVDINVIVEVKNEKGWIIRDIELSQLENRNYAIFGFLADIKNISMSPFISEPKGLPVDSEWLNSEYEKDWFSNLTITQRDNINDGSYYGKSYLTLKELLDYDYEQEFINRRITVKTEYGSDGGVTGTEEQGEKTTMRKFLGEGFFKDLEILQSLDNNPENVRIIFWFF